MSARPILEVNHLRAGYVAGVHILAGISLAAAEHAVTLIIGPNGAGKSTLLRTIFGLLQPAAGNVLLRGKDVSGARPAVGSSMSSNDGDVISSRATESMRPWPPEREPATARRLSLSAGKRA